MSQFILLESGSDLLEEDGASRLLLEAISASVPIATPDPSQAQWTASSSFPDPSQAQWSLSSSCPDPSQAQWSFYL